MSRIQLAINVSDLQDGIEFYSRMFGVTPAKIKPGYANFEIENPPLKLVLFEVSDTEGGTLNHLGVEVETPEEVSLADTRLSEEGLETTGISNTLCCFAEKTETWVTDPDNLRWEWYVKQGDSEIVENTVICC